MRASHGFDIGRKGLAFAVAAALLLGATSSARAQIAFDDVSIPAGFANTGTETWGASWGDIDGDNYPDIYIGNHRTRAALYRNNRNGTFTNVSQQVDLSDTPGWTGGRPDVDMHGASWGDVDNDGDDDLIQSVSSGDDYIFINDNGLLTQKNAQYGLGLLRHSATRQNLFLDVNGDGRLDLANISLNRPAFSPQLANKTFGAGSSYEIPISCSSDAQWAHLVDVNPSPGLELLCAPRKELYPKSISAFQNGVITNVVTGFPQFGPVNDAISLDYNRDLRPDIFMVRGSERPSDAYQMSPEKLEVQLITAANKTKSVTFKSSGLLSFKVSTRAGSDPQGDPIYIDIGAGGYSPGSLQFQLNKDEFKNQGIQTGSTGINIGYITSSGVWKLSLGNTRYSYTYLEVTSTAPITDVVFTGASASDLGQTPILLANTEAGFAKVTTAGFTAAMRCMSVVSGDFDNDMDEDLFLTCTAGTHNIADKLFMNNGNGKFTEIADAGGAAGVIGAAVGEGAGTGESVVTADYDLDGFLDLFVTNGSNMRPLDIGGPKQLFRNRGNANNWIQFDLEGNGTNTNRDGTGSKVYVTSNGVTQYREQGGGYHRWSQNFRRVHVGLAGNTLADVRVVWPNGEETNYAGLQSNGIYQLKQDGTSVLIAGGVDTDGDGLVDAKEAMLGTDPNVADTDGDGLNDGAEVASSTNPLIVDTDGDGLSDGDEVNIYATNPLKKDTDADGLTDRSEILFKGTDALNPDTDGDGLKDGQEAGANCSPCTNPLLADTDGGSVNDGVEVGRGTDPLSSADDL